MVVYPPYYFQYSLINDLLKEVEQAELGIKLSSGKTFGGMLFVHDFVYRC